VSKKTIYLISFALVLGLVPTIVANAADPNLVGWWRFNGTTDDLSIYGNHGTIHGNPQWVEGKYLKALQFDGVDDYVDCGNDASLNITGPLITLEAWVKPNRTSGYDQAIVGKWDWLNNRRSYALYILSNGQAYFMLSEAGTLILANDSVTSATTIVVGEWWHIVGVSDGTRKRIFINGIEEASNSAPSNLFSSTEPVHVGSPDGETEFFQGIIDEVRLYNRGLTQEEIRQPLAPEPHNRAYYPEPHDGAIDVPRDDVVLSWRAGDFADKHDVYVGTSFDDVDNATNLDTMGADMVYRARQGADSYAIPERLDFGQTYYWRIDEVNAPPTSHEIFKGDVWSFTVEPLAYAIENITATASSSQLSREPENTVNSSGLDETSLLHGRDGDNNMWLSDTAGPQPTWIGLQTPRDVGMEL
jgi:hypothetical protein